jgi:hypothetical protein
MSHDSAAYLENFATTRRTAGRAPDPLPPTLSPSRSTSSCCRPHAAVTSAISRSDVSRLRDSRAGNQPASPTSAGPTFAPSPGAVSLRPYRRCTDAFGGSRHDVADEDRHLIRRWCHPDRRSMIAKATGSKPPAHHSTAPLSLWRGAGRLAGTGYRSCNNRHPGRPATGSACTLDLWNKHGSLPAPRRPTSGPSDRRGSCWLRTTRPSAR